MKIVADENIPFVEHYFGQNSKVLYKPGRLISKDDLSDARILLVRSVTEVNQSLLQDTSIQFVGSATAGADHLDTHWLDQMGIDWAIAAGCNASAVADYVKSVIIALQQQGFLKNPNKKAGVIGVGYVGKLVVDVLQHLEFDVIQCDPIRNEREKSFLHVPLESFSQLDFISLHTPLTHEGKFPTHHMIEKNFLEGQKKGCFLLNAGRGSVISFADLKRFGKHLYWCLDVWENEPNIDKEVLKEAFIATPHIAGYSKEAKRKGIEMIYEAAVNKKWILPVPMLLIDKEKSISFDPMQATIEMKKGLLEGSETFDNLRKNFPERS